jgi:fatty acid desaturase
MEFLIVAVIGGVLLAFILMKLIWIVVSGAVDNGVDWLIHTFGNESARAEVEEKWRERGRMMSKLGIRHG